MRPACSLLLHARRLACTTVFATTLALSLTGCAHDAGTRANAASSAPGVEDTARLLAQPTRNAEDRERDARDRPAEVLAHAGFGPDDTVADIFGGGGYYSELLASIVGADGHVLLVNNAPYDAYAKKGLGPRLADNRLPNVRYTIVPNEALGLGENTLDGALIVMSYHDLYHADPKGGWPAIDAGRFIDQIVVALKPGGRLLIVDHAAREGSGKTDAQTLHRIDEAFAIADFTAHGLVFDGRLDLLRNPDDPRTQNVFDPAIRGRTDRFVHRYRKP